MRNEGRELVAKLETWVRSWIVFRRPDDALACVLWALNTWTFDVFDAVPYLCISAATKGAGKTALLDTLASISLNAEMLTDPHAANMMRLASQSEYNGRVSFFIDEAEKLNRETCDARPYMNSGYRKGASIPRVMPGGYTQKFSTFCAKAFSLIGDVYDTLRDRSIVVRLVRSAVERRFRPSLMRAEARELVFEIRRVMEPLQGGMAWADDRLLEHLKGRDEEIWLPLFSLAVTLGLSPADIDRLRSVSADLTAEKTDEARNFIELRATAEAAATADTYSERAIADLLSVLREGEPAIFSDVAVERMRALPVGPWRTFKGTGLTVNVLASLVDRFGLKPTVVRMERGRQAKQLKGYRRDALDRAAVEAGVSRG